MNESYQNITRSVLVEKLPFWIEIISEREGNWYSNMSSFKMLVRQAISEDIDEEVYTIKSDWAKFYFVLMDTKIHSPDEKVYNMDYLFNGGQGFIVKSDCKILKRNF